MAERRCRECWLAMQWGETAADEAIIRALSFFFFSLPLRLCNKGWGVRVGVQLRSLRHVFFFRKDERRV